MGSTENLPLLAEQTIQSQGTTVEPRYNDTNFSAIFLRYTEVSFNQGSRAGIINKEGPP